jgi:hypothetical protein
MANTITGPAIQFQGDRKLINTCFVTADGGSASSITLVDVSALTPSGGNNCTRVALNKIWYQGAGAANASATMAWDATTDVPFLSLNYDNNFDFSSFGGLQNTQAAGYSGDVLLEIPTTSVAGQEYVVWCEWIKYYD